MALRSALLTGVALSAVVIGAGCGGSDESAVQPVSTTDACATAIAAAFSAQNAYDAVSQPKPGEQESPELRKAIGAATDAFRGSLNACATPAEWINTSIGTQRAEYEDALRRTGKKVTSANVRSNAEYSWAGYCDIMDEYGYVTTACKDYKTNPAYATYAREEGKTPPTTRTANPAKTPPSGPSVAKAIAAAKAEKPDIPAWRDAKFSGVVFSPTEVCVTQVMDIGGQAMASHVIVTWPDLIVGEPLDGKCAKSGKAEGTAQTAAADKAIETARAFYLKMDDLALKLEDAVAAAQDGGDPARVAALRETIKKANDAYLMDTGEMSIGANQLQSAATKARDAANAGDIATMARARADIREARNTLADEAIN